MNLSLTLYWHSGALYGNYRLRQFFIPGISVPFENTGRLRDDAKFIIWREICDYIIMETVPIFKRN